ncbi:MAG TPA: Ig-like domain-containing protein [Solirubrobacteraceae bacterium]|nr:Ig-like domain-containing protein [Solirubrobacteraceae bacterium]
MATGNFSNGGQDTFDATRRYIGVRLQQGVPLLDRDWNELEDTRRYVEWSMRDRNIGEGAPDDTSFEIAAPTFPAAQDVVIRTGHYSVGGYDIWNEQDTLFSEQGARTQLPAATQDDILIVYVEPQVNRVTAAEDPSLANSQDINLETCVRDRLDWVVGVVRQPDVPPAGASILAEIHRPAGTAQITDAMIVDRRRTGLELADAVDRCSRAERRLDALEHSLGQAQLDIAQIKDELGHLFWDVTITATRTDMLFGASAVLTITVKDKLGTPVQGAQVALSSDWGSIDPAIASTDASGQATAEFAAVPVELHPPPPHIGLLGQVAGRLELARLANPGAIQYAQVHFAPEEIGIISRYAPPSWLVDLSPDIPQTPIVARPGPRTATVTAHAKEPSGAIVRGVGSAQVTVGLWLRDWALTKVLETTTNVAVGARVGNLMRQGLTAAGFDHDTVANGLPATLQSIHDDTHESLKRAVFVDPSLADDDVHGSGHVSQAIAQEATAAVGAGANRAVNQQLDQFVAGGLAAATADDARTRIVQASSTIHAGFAQNQRQLFASPRIGA